MSDHSAIEWTESTWNPVTGCSKISPGCAHCYAERISLRFGHSKKPWLPEHAADNVTLHPDRLRIPLRWRTPRRVFVNSMSDLFHELVPDAFIDQVFAVMAAAPQHTFQILTKRPARMLKYFGGGRSGADLALSHRIWMAAGLPPAMHWPLRNVWLGVSTENQRWADDRIPLLLNTPAGVRFVSAEPLLGPIDFTRWTLIAWRCSYCLEYFSGPLRTVCPACRKSDCWSGSHKFNGARQQVGSGLDWIIVGGESGPGSRPMHPAWPRWIRHQCAIARVSFFFKQWGEWQPVAPVYDDDDAYEERIANAEESRCEFVDETGARWPEAQPPPGSWTVERVGKGRAGRELDGRTWDEMPA